MDGLISHLKSFLIFLTLPRHHGTLHENVLKEKAARGAIEDGRFMLVSRKSKAWSTTNSRNYWPKKRQSAASITHLFQSKWPPENVAVSDGVDILNTRHFLPDFKPTKTFGVSKVSPFLP